MFKSTKMKRTVSIINLFCMMFLSFSFQVYAKTSDIAGHWAQSTLQKWSDLGWLNGDDDGKYCPDDEITRAEFLTLVNRMKGYTELSDKVSQYADVSNDKWYYADIGKALAAGYIRGTSTVAMSPEKNITRQEAMVLITKISGIDTAGIDETILNNIDDGDKVSEWARTDVAANIAEGFVAGVDKKIYPQNDITRAEAVVLLERINTDIRTYAFAGTYGPEESKKNINSAIVLCSGITLKNINVKDELKIDKAIGEGETSLINVKIGGKLNIYGGGLESIHISGCDINEITTEKANVRIVLGMNTKVNILNVTGTQNIIESKNGTNVKFLTLSGNDSTVIIEEASKVDNLVADAAVNIKGKGLVNHAKVNANGTSFETRPSTIVLGSGITAKIDNKEYNGETSSGRGSDSSPVSKPEPTSTPAPTTTPEPVSTSTPAPTVTPEPAPTSTPAPTVTPEPGPTSTPVPTTTPEPGPTSTPVPNVPVTGIRIQPLSKAIKVGEQFTIVATVEPSNATNKAIQIFSENIGVANVVDGVVSGIAPGVANITAKTPDGSITASCSVTADEVKILPAPKYSFNFQDTTANAVYSEGRTIVAINRGAEIVDTLIGKGIQFEYANNDYLDLGYTVGESIYGKSGVTVSFWFNNEDIPTGTIQYRPFISFINGGTAGLQIALNQEGILVAGRSKASDKFSNRKYPFAKYNQWQHVMVVFNFEESTIRVYLNGTELSNTLNDPKWVWASKTYARGIPTKPDGLGGDPSTGFSMNGSIASFLVYDRALTAEENKAVYESYGIDANDQLTPEERESLRNSTLLETLKQNDGIAFFTGKPKAIVEGKYYRYIDPTNLQATPVNESGTIMVPIEFIAKAFGWETSFDTNTQEITIQGPESIKMTVGGTNITVGSSVYALSTPIKNYNSIAMAPFTEFCQSIGKYAFYDHRGLIIISDKENILDPVVQSELITFAVEKFTISHYVEPVRDHTMGRVQLGYIDPVTQGYIGNPSILVMSDGTYIATHDYHGIGRPEGGSVTDVYRSLDKGLTWTYVTRLRNTCGVSLFEHDGALYVLGTSIPRQDIIIRKSTDKGTTWTEPVEGVSGTGFLVKGGAGDTPPNYLSTSVPILIANGRIFKSYDVPEPNVYASGFKAFFISADINSNLLDESSWVLSNKLPFEQSWVPSDWTVTNAMGWMEGSMVKKPDGNLALIQRLNSTPTVEKAARIEIVDQGGALALQFNPGNGFFQMPGGMSRFSIKYDSRTGKYLALVNNNTDPEEPDQRNVLSLAYSDDLVNWNIAETVLVDYCVLSWKDSIEGTGFQYVDWSIDGNDMIFIVRESSDGGDSYHNSNRAVYYKIKDYAKYINKSQK